MLVIARSAFSGCSSLASITVPGSVNTIEDSAFYNCTSLTSASLGSGILSIGPSAFRYCSKLAGIVIPDSVTSLGYRTFQNCTSLTNAVIGSGITSFGYNAFSDCTSLASVTIRYGVTSIADYAFSGCTRLASVTIPASVSSIGNSAFYGCTSLTGVYFLGNAPSLGSSVFYGDNNATVYYLPGTTGWGSMYGGRPTALWDLPPDATVSNVRANQRSGTTVVDLFYDLSGTGSGYSVSVTVSSNSGASFSVPATHFTGDGVTTTVAPGAARHILWDAGSDFPSQFSTKMRLKVAVGRAFALSPIFTLNTRTAQTGTLTGLLQGSGAPVANAQARIDGTGFATSTGADGRFTLANVPAGSGYLLKVSAAGFAYWQKAGLTVTSGTTDLGTITLGTATGPYQIIPLAPDVNPATTTIEQGGTAYRYYLMQNSAGKAQGGVAVSVQVAGGSPIPQAQDVSGYWPGQVAGTSDADGIVRIAIPSSDLRTPGTVQTIQISLSGQVQQTFKAQAMPNSYDQFWRQKLGAGASVEVLPLVSVGSDTLAESELRHTMVNKAVTTESISRIQTTKGQVFLGQDVGSSLSISSAKLNLSGGAEATAELNAFVGLRLRSTYDFNPNNPDNTDPLQNAMKLYMDLGNVLTGLPGPAASFYQFAKATVEPMFLSSQLQSVGGDVIWGGGLDLGGQVGFSIAGGRDQAQVSLQGGLSGDMEGIVGMEASFGTRNESATVVGVAASGSAIAGGGLSLVLGNLVDLNPDKLTFGWGTSAHVELDAKRWTRAGQSIPYRTELIAKLSLDAKHQIPVGAWQQYDPPALYGNYEREFTETLEQTTGTKLVSYQWSVSAAQQSADLDLNVNIDVIGVKLKGELDQGAEAVNQRGTLWRAHYWPTESYPAVTADLLPTQSWSSILTQWGKYAAGPIGKAVQWVATTVDNAADTIVHVAQQVGAQTYNAVLTVKKGAVAGGSQIISSVSSGVSSLFGHHGLSGGPLGPSPKDVTATNLVYGIGGVYRFQCTNSFNGTATLTISYSSGDVSGLNPADLRIYYLPDGTNRWQLMGGTVNLASNTVSATITNLGTYAAAPPLPTGDLQLVSSTNLLSADGASQMTITVTNLMLNTGNAATQQWAFTAAAAGVTILSQDMDTNMPGVQVYSTNGTITLKLLAPQGGNAAHVSLASVAGDAYGSTAINLLDNTAPSAPTGVSVSAGQSRIWVSWQTNSEPDTAGYRVYYRLGQVGPSWDGTAAVEGTASPVLLAGTNWLLRGLLAETNYFVAVSAVDTTGNESPLSPPIQVTTTPAAPAPPTAVAARFGPDGTDILMWALSEDDGYNDRDVVRYDVFRAVLPGGSYVKVGEASAGVGFYTETNTTVGNTQCVAYAVTAVATNGLSSSQTFANRLMADGITIDTDGDGIPDWWLAQYFGHPTGQPSDHSFAWNDPAGDGLSNLQKYLLGLNPLVAARPYLQPLLSPTTGSFALNIAGLFGRSVTLEVSTDLTNWQALTNLTSTNAMIYFEDLNVTNSACRFYRGVVP